FFCNLASGGEPRFIYIAESGKTDSGNPQECPHQLLAAAANPDDAKIDLIGRRLGPRVPGFRQEQSTAQRFRCADNKVAPIHLACWPFVFGNAVARSVRLPSPALSCHRHCTNRCDSISPRIHSPRASGTVARIFMPASGPSTNMAFERASVVVLSEAM